MRLFGNQIRWALRVVREAGGVRELLASAGLSLIATPKRHRRSP